MNECLDDCAVSHPPDGNATGAVWFVIPGKLLREEYVPGVTAMTRQSIGLPTALPGSGEAARGPSPLPLAPLAQAER